MLAQRWYSPVSTWAGTEEVEPDYYIGWYIGGITWLVRRLAYGGTARLVHRLAQRWYSPVTG